MIPGVIRQLTALTTALAVVLPSAAAFADPQAVAATKRPPPVETLGPPSQAVTTQTLDAIAQELNRSMTQLQIPGAPKPYHIAYKITEVDVNDVAASLGFTTSRRNRHFVNLEARVRVGSVDFDNGNFVVPNADEIDAVSAINLPIESDPRTARRAAWLVSDAAYKEALIQLRAKIEARGATGGHGTGVPAWTAEAPVVSDAPVLVPPLESLDELEARAKTLSALFRDQPAVRDSRVAVTSYLERRWYLTTEGTSVADTRRASGIVMAANGQADDGQELHQDFLRYGHTARDLPTDDELKVEAKRLGDTVAQLAKAPIIDHYSGPVLFEGEGAVGIIRATLSPNLGGTPVPEGLNPQDAKQFGGQLTDKIGLRVLAPMLSLVDDPTATTGGGKALIGGYKIDDEGTPAQKVEVVKNGTLKTLLTSRTPSQKGVVSNGHARRTADGGAFHGSATNLFVIGSGGVSRKELEARLVSTARGEGLKYGLVIKQIDDPAITSAPEYSRRELVSMIKSTDQELPPPTTVAYRVYPNGKQELVRGVQLEQVPIRAWKDVIGVSNTTLTYNYLAPTETPLQLKLTAGNDDGYVPSGGIESAIVTPDLLFKEIDVTSSTAGIRAMPAIPRPAK